MFACIMCSVFNDTTIFKANKRTKKEKESVKRAPAARKKGKKAGPKKASLHTTKKASPKKAGPKKASLLTPKKASPKNASLKKASPPEELPQAKSLTPLEVTALLASIRHIPGLDSSSFVVKPGLNADRKCVHSRQYKKTWHRAHTGMLDVEARLLSQEAANFVVAALF